ncbi:hypothetical protein [Spirosoma endbachense]|uniref:PQQ-binding-like beta-propeller repeat protein n=1 Tax=Spirosoma endbachense TaxID=2666025 RepID=A0A6P1VWG3_9BACT|nr:hypothetical protein [Spirosoma endbachense]QHV97551.1 hypothetical protein GJR95_22205 [Spirosoma endbachense]
MQITRASSNGYAISYGDVLRLSESGSTLWQSSIPPSPELPSYSNTPTYITAIPDGGFGVLVYNKFRWSLARLNADGVTQWVKSFANNETESASLVRTFTSLIYTVDGGFLAAGYTQSGRNGTYSEVYKFDSEGNNTISKTVGSNYGNNPRPIANAKQVIQTIDGNYLLVGVASDPDLNEKAWVVKLDQQLTMTWRKHITGNNFDDVIRNPYADGSFIVTGAINSTGNQAITIGENGDVIEGFSLSGRVIGTKSLLVAGVNPTNHTIIDVVNERSGDLRLQNLIGQNQSWLQKVGGSSAETIKSAVASNDGGYLLVGTTASTDGDVQGKTNTDLSAWIVKLGPVCTGEIYSVHDGNWNDPSTWSCGQIPTSTDIVHVKHEVVLPQNVVAAARRIIYDLPVRLKWEEGASLQLSQ